MATADRRRPGAIRARRGRATSVVLLLGSTLTVMAGAILAPVLDLIRRDLELGPTAAGLVLTVHGLSLAVSSPLVGRAVDRYGTQPVLAAGLLVYGLAGGAGVAIDGFAALVVSRLVFGVGAAAVFTGTTVALLERYDGPRRDRVMGWRAAAISLGGVTFPLLGGALGAISWHAPFGAYLAGVPLGLVTVALLPQRAPAGHVARPADGGLVALVRVRPALGDAYALQLLAAVLLSTILVFLPLRLGELGIRNPLVVAASTAALSAAMTASGFAYARLRPRAGDLGLIRAALAVWTLALAGAATARDAPTLAATAVLFGVGMGLAVPALTTLVGTLASEALRGRATSLLATATFAGQLVAPLLFGPIVAATSTGSAFLAAAAMAAAALLVARRRAAGGSGRAGSRLP